MGLIAKSTYVCALLVVVGASFTDALRGTPESTTSNLVEGEESVDHAPAEADDNNLLCDFEAFRAKYPREYLSAGEEELRRTIFNFRVAGIRACSADTRLLSDSEPSVTKFTDWTEEELRNSRFPTVAKPTDPLLGGPPRDYVRTNTPRKASPTNIDPDDTSTEETSFLASTQSTVAVVSKPMDNSTLGCDSYYTVYGGSRSAYRGQYNRGPAYMSCGGKSIYIKQGDANKVLFFANSNNWWIGTKQSAENCDARGFLYASSSCVCPSDCASPCTGTLCGLVGAWLENTGGTDMSVTCRRTGGDHWCPSGVWLL